MSRALTLLHLLVLPNGAIGRAAFLGGMLALCGASWLGDRALAVEGPGPHGPWDFVFVLLVAWMAGCLARKRLHDLDRSGLLIPLFLGVVTLAAVVGPVLLMLCDGLLPDWAPAALAGLCTTGPMSAWLAWLGAWPGRAARSVEPVWAQRLVAA